MYSLDNDYTVLCYHYFGKFGYWLVLVSTLITLWGSDMGTMVLMTDLLVTLPGFSSVSENEQIRRIVATIFLLIICWITCIFKNPTYYFSKLMNQIISWNFFFRFNCFNFSIHCGSYVSIFLHCHYSYGGRTYGINWDSSVLWPQGVMGVLSTIGIVINAFGFMLLLFPLYVIISFTIYS